MDMMFHKMMRRTTGWLVLFCAVSFYVTSAPIFAQAQTSAPPAPPDKPQASVTPEHKISSAEAAELFRSVDEILKFASQETALPQRHEVKRRLVNRDEVVAYIE